MHFQSRGLAAVFLLAALAACGEEGDVSRTASSTPVEASSGAGTAQAAPVIDREALEAKGYAIGDVVLGDPKAPVTLIEYASLTCPACKAFHSNTLPSIKRDYINTGKVKLIIRELHGARIGLYGAALARCAGPDRYYAFVDVLFSRQDNYRTQDPAANIAELRRIGKLGGLSPEKIDACLNDNVYLNALYQDSIANLEKDDVPATPYLIVQPGDGQKTFRGAIDAATLGEALDGFVAAAAKSE